MEKAITVICKRQKCDKGIALMEEKWKSEEKVSTSDEERYKQVDGWREEDRYGAKRVPN